MGATKTTTGDVVAAVLQAAGASTAFGVISIHNLPILDAFGRGGALRFVPARSEAGAVNMADGWARAGGRLGVAVTSTGTGAGNAAGAMIEAMTAGTPMLHLTGQIDLPYLDRNRGYIHEAPDQIAMLRAVSKAAYRIWSPESAVGTLHAAIRDAFTAPAGPVSVEIPIDVQKAPCDLPAVVAPLLVPFPAPDPHALDELAAMTATARRPLLWLGGGARHAGDAVRRLVEMGFGVVTSVAGRGVLPESHPMSLGAFSFGPEVESLYATCDLLIVAGSRLRSNETRSYTLPLPSRRVQIDADPRARNRSYPVEHFICADSAAALGGLADRLAGRSSGDRDFPGQIAETRAAAEGALRRRIGPYGLIADALGAAMPGDALWVRDVTIANSTWGNRLPSLSRSRQGIHALGGGIGQALQMAIGASLGGGGRKTVALVGDGGLMLNLGELATAVQECAPVTIIVMNDGGYGVIRNIQDAYYGGRRHFVDLHTPSFVALGRAMGMASWHADSVAAFGAALGPALAVEGPALVEVDMRSIGPYPVAFAGPPPPEKR